MDIKKWGDEKANSDIYYINTNKKEPFKMFCDLVTDGGGWGLFYNYIHHPLEVYQVGGDELPTDP